MRRFFLVAAILVLTLNAVGAVFFPWILWSMILFGPLILLGLYDGLQTRRAVLRNFPVIGHCRYLLEAIRPEISQYFIETQTSGVPFNREHRSLVYQRSKKTQDTIPFGTLHDVYGVGYEWVNHSLSPTRVNVEELRVQVGGKDCKLPYRASLFNISAMSYGSLSKNAIMALNEGARIGNFAHNTGEGGISRYHLSGGDLIWQIGTGYFGCRSEDGSFDARRFEDRASLPTVRMIEVKLSQGAKPGHGGILPAAKLTREIAEIRGVAMGKDVVSPSAHSAFSTPRGLLEFVQRLRELSGGKPVGFKLCVGKRREFLAICKAMVETGLTPDFITVDGGEGGTGAAPLEFTNRIGTPLVEGLILVHNALIGYSLRDRIRIVSAGKITSGFNLVRQLALGADLCSAARPMMLALGCIQALRCNTNLCPVGVATQKSELVAGLVPKRKRTRVANFHAETLESVAEIMGAMGVKKASDLRPWHILRRTGANEVKHFGEIWEFLEDGALLADELPEPFRRACEAASPDTFESVLDS